jgi:hypothetical protein
MVIAVMAIMVVILLSILQDIYLTAEPNDSKTKSPPKDGGEKSSVPKDGGKKTTVPKDEVKTPTKAPRSRSPAIAKTDGREGVYPCLHDKEKGCSCPRTYCGCEETGFVPRMLSTILTHPCCGCGRANPTNACVNCDCMFHNNCFKR